MKVLNGARPSPAMIVGMLALVLAVSGTAIAFDPTKANVKKIAKKQSNKRLKANVPGSHVNLADSATTADTASIGLSPVAYARVDSTGNVIEADSRGVTDANVSLESTSAYCFRGLGFEFKTAQATADYGDPVSGGLTGSYVQVSKGDVWNDCAAGGGGVQLEVAGSDVTVDETFEPVGFYIWFYN